MSFKLLAAVTAYIDEHSEELSFADRAFLWGTADFANQSALLWPGEEAWRRRTGLSRAGLHKQISKWVKAGLLVQREPGRRGHRAVYQLVVPTAQQDPTASTPVDTKSEFGSTGVDTKPEIASTSVDTKSPIVSTESANCVYPGRPLPYRTCNPPSPYTRVRARESQPPLVAAVPGGGGGDDDKTRETPRPLKPRSAQPNTDLHPDAMRVVRELLPELARNRVTFTRHKAAEFAAGVSQALAAGVSEDVIREAMLESYDGTHNPSAAAVSRVRKLVTLPAAAYQIEPVTRRRKKCPACQGHGVVEGPDGRWDPCPTCRPARAEQMEAAS